ILPINRLATALYHQRLRSPCAEAEPMLLPVEHVETIEAIADEVRADATFAADDKQTQRAIFQLPDVHVTLDPINKKRRANVICAKAICKRVGENHAADSCCHAIYYTLARRGLASGAGGGG